MVTDQYTKEKAKIKTMNVIRNKKAEGQTMWLENTRNKIVNN